MTTTTTTTATTNTSIEQEPLWQNSTNCFIENNVEVLLKILNDIDIDLDSILVDEFEPGLLTELKGF